MELATSIRVIKSSLFTFSLLLFTSSAFADVTLVAPKEGETVSLLKDAQRDYLALPMGARREKMGDAVARKAFATCGGRPAAVTFEWRDDAGTTDTVYMVELTCIETGSADRFEVRGMKTAIVNLETGRNYEWEVKAKGKGEGEAWKSATFATAAEPRLMMFPGVGNCRDLGGRVGLDGKRLRQGRVYRTAAYNGSSKKVGDSFFDTKYLPGPDRVTKSGRREMVEQCGVKTDLDLRGEQECAGMVGSPLGTNVVWVHIPIRAYGWLENDKEAMVRILMLFTDEKNYPIAFHCSGGRDRAGSLAFILEGLCGVNEDEMMKDWEFSIFETDDLGFAPSRMDGLVEMLARHPGETMSARITHFVKSCGLTDDDIAKIRTHLMEK